MVKLHAPRDDNERGLPLNTVWREIVRASSPRTLGLLLVVAACVLLVLNAVEAPPFRIWSFRALLALPGVLTGSAFLAAALVAAQLSGAGSRRRLWLAAALLLGLLAFEQLGSLHERAELKLGGHEPLFAGSVLACASALVAVAVGLRTPLLGAGAALFAGARLVELLTDSEGAANVAGTLEVLAAAAILPATVAALQARPGWSRSEQPFDVWGVTRTFTLESEPGRVAQVLAAIIVALAVGGLLVNVGGAPVEFLDMNQEETAPAFVSGAFLFTAALLCFLLARLPLEDGRSPGWWSLFGWCLLLLGIDEIGAIHESIQEETGVKGQVFLLPLVAALGAAWLVALGRVPRQARLLLIGGAAGWALSQVLDVLQGTDREDHPTIVPEEVSELTGSALFILALLLAARVAGVRDRESDGAPHRALAPASAAE